MILNALENVSTVCLSRDFIHRHVSQILHLRSYRPVFQWGEKGWVTVVWVWRTLEGAEAIVTFSTELTAMKLHLPCEPWLGWGYLLSSSSYISWKGWSWLQLCIVFYRDSLYLKEQNSKLDLKANRFKTSVTSLVGLTEALEELDFPCCWTSEQLGLKLDLGKMLEPVTAPPSQFLLSRFGKQMSPSISADLLPVVTSPILPLA